MKYSAENPKFAYTDDLHRVGGVPFEGKIPKEIQKKYCDNLSKMFSEYLSQPENKHDLEVIDRMFPDAPKKKRLL